MAKLRYYYGCMGSSKTLRLLTTAYNFEEKGITFGVFKPAKDTRDGDNIIKSRAGMERECTMVRENDNLYTIIESFRNVMNSYFKQVRFVLIDECQFLTSTQVEQLTKVVDKLGIDVFCYGLRTDFQTKLFEGSKRLFELADEIEEIPSMCDCGKRTSVNARFDKEGNIIFEGEQIFIGGNEQYKAICRDCYMEAKSKKYSKKTT